MDDTTALGDRICELAAHLNAANCRFLELIAQFDLHIGWGAEGCNSCAHWLNWKCGISLNAAREPEDGAQFIDAIERAAKELKAQQGDEEESIARMPYSTSRADALMHAIVERADTEVQVHVSAETLVEFDSEGYCHLHDGPNLAPHTVRHLSCDAGIVRIVEDGKGQPLDVGRKTRSYPTSVKTRAIDTRSGLPLPRLRRDTTFARPPQRNAQLGLVIDEATAYPN